MTMRQQLAVAAALLGLTATTPALAGNPFDAVTDAAKKVAPGVTKEVERRINAKLTTEARKNQCSFKTDTDELAPGCDAKLKKLTNALVEAKKHLQAGGVKRFKFEVSGHTDSAGSAEHNKQLSEKRAQVIVKELVARGIAPSEIIAVG